VLAEAEAGTPSPSPTGRGVALTATAHGRSAPSKPSAGAEQAALAARVTEELGFELGRHRDLRTVVQGELDQLEPSRRPVVRFSVGGRLREVNGDLRVTAQLVDRATGEQLWGDEYHTTPGAGRWSGSLDDVARVIAVRVGGEEGIVVQRLVGEFRKRRHAVITPFGAILLAYEFFLARDPQALLPTLEALRHVVKADPAGVASSRLARVLDNHAFELTRFPPIEEAISCAHHGASTRLAELAASSPRLGQRRLRSARDELEALWLSPSRWSGWHIGYFLCCSETASGTTLMGARRRNPYAPPNATMGLCPNTCAGRDPAVTSLGSARYYYRGVAREPPRLGRRGGRRRDRPSGAEA
jgi:TolB-like protein